MNELYLELKGEAYDRVNASFRTKAAWRARPPYLVELSRVGDRFPEKRKVSVQLNVSDVITAETRAKMAAERGTIDSTLRELGSAGRYAGCRKDSRRPLWQRCRRQRSNSSRKNQNSAKS